MPAPAHTLLLVQCSCISLSKHQGRNTAYLRRLLGRAAAAVAVKHAEQRRGRARARQLGLSQRHILITLRAVRQPCWPTFRISKSQMAPRVVRLA